MRVGIVGGLAASIGLVLAAGPLRAAEPERVSFPGPDGITLFGALYRPSGPEPHPAVVALHGCSGLYDRRGDLTSRHSDWGTRLSEAGFVVLLPDSYGPRDLGSQCRVRMREVRPGSERVKDAFAAKAFLQRRPDVVPTAISVLGWSNGGATVLYTAASGMGEAASGPDFARAVAFYPGCRVPFERGWRGRIPLLVLIGAADDWTPARPCEALAVAAKARGEPVEIVTYPGAYHDFDAPDRPVREVRGLAYTADGGGVAHTGTDPAARADALARVPGYLAGGPPGGPPGGPGGESAARPPAPPRESGESGSDRRREAGRPPTRHPRAVREEAERYLERAGGDPKAALLNAVADLLDVIAPARAERRRTR